MLSFPPPHHFTASPTVTAQFEIQITPMPLDPAATTATSSRPISPLPHHHYPSSQQHQQQTLPVRSPNPPTRNPFLYPFASSGPSRSGFVPKGVGTLATAADHAVTGCPPPPLLYSHGGVRGMNLDYLTHALHGTRPLSAAQFPHLAHSPSTTTAAAASPSIKGHSKASARSAVSDVNGHKDTSIRERSRDDSLTVVRDRKVRITEDASLYALCRSWLRNGVNEEIQPQQKDVMNALPKPSPASMVASCISNKKDSEEDKDELEEDEKSVEHLSTQDLLKRHIVRAKKVRARLREERSQRIARYRSRLRLLLP